MRQKPFSQACENNKDPILQAIKTFFISQLPFGKSVAALVSMPAILPDTCRMLNGSQPTDLSIFPE